MIHKLFLIAALSLPLADFAQSQNKVAGVRTTYTDDPEIEAEIDYIVDKADAQISESLNTSSPSRQKKVEGQDVWWESDAAKSVMQGADQQITLNQLYIEAIEHSTQIKVFSDVPLIRETAIQEAEGAFDTRGFAETAYERTNDPVTTLLETGEQSGRFTQDRFRHESGIRKRIITGAEISISQQLGFVDNNSQFLVPNPQGTSRLRLAIVQPILKGAGIAYNHAIMDVARIDTAAAFQEHIRQAESHLLEICRAYWTLYFTRVSYARKTQYLKQAEEIAAELKSREDLDAVEGQLARASSAVAFRESELARAQMDIANAQDRIRTLVNSPKLGALDTTELIPSDRMFARKFPANYETAARRAIRQRPEILQAIQQIRAAAVREKMSRNEILPELNLILEGYVAGVDRNRDFIGAWENQYTQGGPGGLIGLSIEFPFENNEAKARLERRRIELRQQFNQLRTTIDTVLLEVQASVREVETSWADYTAKLAAVEAASADLEQFSVRRELDTVATPEDEAASTSSRNQSWYLDEWLNTQARLEFAEEDFARVATIYQVALTNLERAQGNLLKTENISVVRTTDQNDLPLLRLEKDPGAKGGYRK